MSAAKDSRPSPLDDTDRRIVHLLQQDGRMSMRDLAAAVHVSRANVYTRVRRLLDDGVIRRFTIQVDPERVGFSTSAYLTMKVEQNSWRRIRDELAALPWVEHVALVSGDFDVLLLVRSASNKTLRDLVFTHIQSMPGVRSTRTLLVFDETDHLPALPGDPVPEPDVFRPASEPSADPSQKTEGGGHG